MTGMSLDKGFVKTYINSIQNTKRYFVIGESLVSFLIF